MNIHIEITIRTVLKQIRKDFVYRIPEESIIFIGGPKMYKVIGGLVCVGSINMDRYRTEEGEIELPGGSVHNTYRFLKKLCSDIGKYRKGPCTFECPEVYLCGLLGDDPEGYRLYNLINSWGGPVNFVEIVPGGKTGGAVITLDAAGERHIERKKNTVTALLPDYVIRIDIKQALKDKAVHVKTGPKVILRLFSFKSEILSCDISGFVGKKGLEVLLRLLRDGSGNKRIRILTGNTEEYKRLIGDISEISGGKHISGGLIEETIDIIAEKYIELNKRERADAVAIEIGKEPILLSSEWKGLIETLVSIFGCEYIFIKAGYLGAIGIRIGTGSGAIRNIRGSIGQVVEGYYVPAPQVKAVDTTGAGDAFNAGVIFGLLCGMTFDKVVTIGCVLGSENCKYRGGQQYIPEAENVISAVKKRIIFPINF